MKADETLEQMYDRLRLLVTEIRTLGSNDWDDGKVTKKLLRAYAPRNQMVATLIREKKRFKTMSPIQLLNKLQYHEMKAKDIAQSSVLIEVKAMALKVEPSNKVESNVKPSKPKKKEESSSDESTEEELAMVVKSLKRLMKRRSEKKGTSQRRCYNCGEKGHFIADCTKPTKEDKDEKKFKDKENEKRYKEKSKEYKKKNGHAHVGEG